MRVPQKDLSGQRFGRLLVIGFAGFVGRSKSSWNVSCDCGAVKIVRGTSLLSGGSKSCGCMKSIICAEVNIRHGMARHRMEAREYLVWSSMKRRCLNPNDRNYPNYGGRGINVCDRWIDSFENFYSDMGPRPPGQYSIERNDNSGNYEPSNCRWATKEEQVNNKRNNIVVVFRGEKMTLSQAVRAAGSSVKITTAIGRHHRGLSIEDVVSA